MKTHFILVLAMAQGALAEPSDKPQAAGQGIRIAVLPRGGGNITGATGKLLSEIWDQEDIIVADVLPARVAAMRAKNPWDRGQRHDLYHQAIVWT